MGHLADFCRFERSGQFGKLKEEVCAFLENKRSLGFAVPCPELRPLDLEERPHFYFLAFCPDIREAKDSMYRYLGVEGHDGRLSKYCAEKVLGETDIERLK